MDFLPDWPAVVPFAPFLHRSASRLALGGDHPDRAAISTAARIHRECLELTRDRARFPARTRPYSSRAPFAPSQTRVGQPSFPSAKIKDLIFPLTFPSPTLLHHHSVHPWSPADCVYLDSMSGYHFPAVMVRCKRAPATRAILHCHANACDVG